jgi:hypothetical protein
MAADGGRCVSDLAVLAGQGALFGSVASVPTARRVLLSIGESEIERVRQDRALARARAWNAGAAPDRMVLDFDATPVSIRSEKEQAAGHYKGGFGFNPLIASCGREVLAGVLRPGTAAANNAADHQRVLELALEQLPQSALDGDSRPLGFRRGEPRVRWRMPGDPDPVLARLPDQQQCPRADPHAR